MNERSGLRVEDRRCGRVRPRARLVEDVARHAEHVAGESSYRPPPDARVSVRDVNGLRGRSSTSSTTTRMRRRRWARHPWALGRPTREVWAEIWDQIEPRISHVLGTGEATYDAGLLLFLERNGYPEETYHSFSYSPVPGTPLVRSPVCSASSSRRRAASSTSGASRSCATSPRSSPP